MNSQKPSGWVAALLFGAWVLVIGWEVQEHHRMVDAAKSDLRGSSHEIASTLSAVTRAFQFRGTIGENGLKLVLDELVRPRTNALVKSSGLLAVGLLNADGDPVVTAGETNLIARDVLNANGEVLPGNGHWTEKYVTFVLPVEGPAGITNAPVVLPGPPRDFTNGPSRRDFPRREPRPEEFNASNNPEFSPTNFPPPPTNAEMFPPPPPDGSSRRILDNQNQ